MFLNKLKPFKELKLESDVHGVSFILVCLFVGTLILSSGLHRKKAFIVIFFDWDARALGRSVNMLKITFFL